MTSDFNPIAKINLGSFITSRLVFRAYATDRAASAQ